MSALTDDVPEVDLGVLGELRRVGEGGQGTVYFTDKILIAKAWQAAYKEYFPGVGFDGDVLRQMAGYVPQLPETDGRWLCEATAWPAALVWNRGQVSGFLMRRIPDRFRKPWGDRGADVPASLQYLLNPQSYLVRKGIRIDNRTRLRLLAEIADVMSRLHSLGIVVGDLSPNNLLVDIDDPACFFIDCDAMRLHGRDVLEQVETPEWRVPRPGYEPTATTASDSYKFGLLAARMFIQDQMGQDVTELAGVSGDLAVLARRSLDVNSTMRPSLGDWRGALHAAGTIWAPQVNHQPGSVPPTPAATVTSPVRQRKPAAAQQAAPSRPPSSPRQPAPQQRPAAQPPQPPMTHPVYVVMAWLVMLLILSGVIGLVAFVVRLF